jgi:hypothetical protein
MYTHTILEWVSSLAGEFCQSAPPCVRTRTSTTVGVVGVAVASQPKDTHTWLRTATPPTTTSTNDWLTAAARGVGSGTDWLTDACDRGKCYPSIFFFFWGMDALFVCFLVWVFWGWIACYIRPRTHARTHACRHVCMIRIKVWIPPAQGRDTNHMHMLARMRFLPSHACIRHLIDRQHQLL